MTNKVLTLDAYNIYVLREVVHDLDLPPDILVILPTEELPFGDGFACVLGPIRLVCAQIGGAKLPLAKLLADPIVISYIGSFMGENRGGLKGRMRNRRRRILHFVNCKNLVLYLLKASADQDSSNNLGFKEEWE